MTLSKTILYISQEYFCSGSGCSVGHNDFLVMFLLWIMPNLCVVTNLLHARGLTLGICGSIQGVDYLLFLDHTEIREGYCFVHKEGQSY